ncbi:MAG: ABC transporter ATP-binding protein [Lachnospiraceae bacterium]|nr:ABC transporter ATP-binding protein [Lachnospiraceae bacterium]
MLFIKNLHKSYHSGNKSYTVLKGIDLSVAEQEFVAVMGPSGSGKSTLLNCISCYIPFDEGSISLGGQNLKGLNENTLAKIRNEKLGFVFQDFMLLDGLTVRENILVPRIIKDKVEPEAEQLADTLLSLFGIAHIAAKYPAEISGGERQRTAVARSLINQPLMILADEPTGNLDSKSSRTVIETFENARKQLGATIFMVTHDSFAASFCDRVILLKDGTVYDSLTRNMTGSESRDMFQDRLLAAIKQMSAIEGRPEEQ